MNPLLLAAGNDRHGPNRARQRQRRQVGNTVTDAAWRVIKQLVQPLPKAAIRPEGPSKYRGCCAAHRNFVFRQRLHDAYFFSFRYDWCMSEAQLSMTFFTSSAFITCLSLSSGLPMPLRTTWATTS